MEIQERVQKLEPGRIIELFELDLTDLGGPVLYFHSSISQGSASIFFGGIEYIPYPISAEGWEITGNATLPRPKLSVSNINSTITALLQDYNQLRNAEVTRTRTFWEYTDGQPGHDSSQYFPRDTFYISRKTEETNLQVVFELVAAADLEGIQLPRGQVMAHACQWIYRGPDCSYTGTALFNQNDESLGGNIDRGAWNAGYAYGVGDKVYILVKNVRQYYVCTHASNAGMNPKDWPARWSFDICGKKLRSCKCRFGVNNPLYTSAFPGTFKLPS